MHIHDDRVIRLEPGATPDYEANNPLRLLLDLVAGTDFAAEREHYHPDTLQHLFAIEAMELYGPSHPAQDVLDPRLQDAKTDFQKQNLASFRAGDQRVVRGLVSCGDWTGPFLRVAYRGGPDSRLAGASAGLGQRLGLWLKVGEVSRTIEAHYNPVSDWYEAEIWGYPGSAAEAAAALSPKGGAALAAGRLLLDADLVRGNLDVYRRVGNDDQLMIQVQPDHALHPILPLALELAWTDGAGVWDSRDGENWRLRFDMVYRGWSQYLSAGLSRTPHGGYGSLDYRNLLSNYGRYAGMGELGRVLPEWSFDANGAKGEAGRGEPFFAVDYMDLHTLRPDSAIGLHRHRDNQEMFFLLDGRALMVVGDWAEREERSRCFEARVLLPGHGVLLKGGQLHALANLVDEPIGLLMFGGYD